MDTILDDTEVRVVGSLLEKQVTTPDYYPLTLNALVHACNQTSNRHPVVSFDEKRVARALDSLREKNFVHVVFSSDGRVPKYKHVVTETFNLTPPELAVICVLMLRGPQTLGEIRGRTNRLYNFQELAEVEATLDALIAKEPRGLAVKLPRQVGQKEVRYAHLLAGEAAVEEAHPPARWETATIEVQTENEKISQLAEEVKYLRKEVAELRQQFGDFKKQFE